MRGRSAFSPPSSAEEPAQPVGSDLDKVDAHVIGREEYEDVPELDAAWFEEADVHGGGKLVRRGRPPKPDRKQLVSLRLSPEVLEHFRASGPGWQTRIDRILHAAVLAERDAVGRDTGGA